MIVCLRLHLNFLARSFNTVYRITYVNGRYTREARAYSYQRMMYLCITLCSATSLSLLCLSFCYIFVFFSLSFFQLVGGAIPRAVTRSRNVDISTTRRHVSVVVNNSSSSKYPKAFAADV